MEGICSKIIGEKRFLEYILFTRGKYVKVDNKESHASHCHGMRKKRNIHKKATSSSPQTPKQTNPYPIYTINPTKTTLFRNCTQFRSKFSTSTTPHSLLQSPSWNLPKLLIGKRHRRNRRPPRSTFFRPSTAGLHKRRTGLDGQCRHFLRLKRLVQPVQRQRKVKLPELELIVVVNGINDVVKVHLVGVADKSRRMFL